LIKIKKVKTLLLFFTFLSCQSVDQVKLAEEYFKIAHHYTEIGDEKEAIRLYTKAISLTSHNSQLYLDYNLAIAYQDLSKPDKALEIIKVLKEEDPENLYLIRLEGSLYYDNKEYQKAVDSFNLVLKKAEGDELSLYNKGYILYNHLNKTEEAYDTLKLYRELDYSIPRNDEAKKLFFELELSEDNDYKTSEEETDEETDEKNAEEDSIDSEESSLLEESNT